MQGLVYQEILTYIRNNDVSSINICGCPASGKSTLANKLSRDLNWNVLDLDDYLYHHGCIRKSIKDDVEIISRLVKQSAIIIDGTYTSSLEARIHHIGLFVLTSETRWFCISRFMLRYFQKKALKCGERFTRKTIHLMLNYKKIEKEKIIPIIPTHKLLRFSGYE